MNQHTQLDCEGLFAATLQNVIWFSAESSEYWRTKLLLEQWQAIRNPILVVFYSLKLLDTHKSHRLANYPSASLNLAEGLCIPPLGTDVISTSIPRSFNIISLKWHGNNVYSTSVWPVGWVTSHVHCYGRWIAERYNQWKSPGPTGGARDHDPPQVKSVHLAWPQTEFPSFS